MSLPDSKPSRAPHFTPSKHQVLYSRQRGTSPYQGSLSSTLLPFYSPFLLTLLQPTWALLLFPKHLPLEKAMAPHSSTLPWKISWMEEPGGLQSMESLRVGHDWATSLSLFTVMHWRRKWQPTPVFLLGESQGWGSLVGCHLWGRTELDTTEVT